MAEDDSQRTSMLPLTRQNEINRVLNDTNIQPMNIMDALIEFDENTLSADICNKLS